MFECKVDNKIVGISLTDYNGEDFSNDFIISNDETLRSDGEYWIMDNDRYNFWAKACAQAQIVQDKISDLIAHGKEISTIYDQIAYIDCTDIENLAQLQLDALNLL